MQVVQANGGLFAAVRSHIAMAEIPSAIMPLVDQVWACLRAAEYKGHSHNVWLYRNHADGEVDVEIGVQVQSRFAVSGNVEIAELPSGPAIHTWHYGEYDQLPKVHDALVRWCSENGRPMSRCAGRSTAIGTTTRQSGARTCIACWRRE